MRQEEIDALWSEHVGSRLMRWQDEIKMIRKVLKEKKVSWRIAYVLYYQTKYWDVVRTLVLQRDEYMCKSCGSKYNLQVDHLKYPKLLGKEDLGLLQVLCRDCHAKKTKRFQLNAGPQQRNPVLMEGGEQLFTLFR